MRFVFINGLGLIALACFLYYRSHYQTIDSIILVAQVAEFVLGLTNLTLIGLNLKHQQHCLPHYSLIENGEIISLQDEVSYFKKNYHRTSIEKIRLISSLLELWGTTVILFISWNTIEENGKSKFYKWTESAICERTANGWKLALIHSTPVK